MECLDFEKPIAELEAKIEELNVALRKTDHGDKLSGDIEVMRKKLDKLLGQIYSNLSPWDMVQLARHPKRPHTQDYIRVLFSDFTPLHGDRHYADDDAITAGIGYFENHPVAVIGHEKGDDTENRIRHNFGMPRPEGYRKALRVFKLAERFHLPILTFIDTPGAYPGIDAEERNQSEAIAENLKIMAGLKTPIICTIIGEGGSGGALAIGVGDSLLMLEYSIYSVISPEGCASILWKSNEKAEQAAAAMCVTAPQLLELGLFDHMIREPKGGAHRNFEPVYIELRRQISAELKRLTNLPEKELLKARYEKIIRRGAVN